MSERDDWALDELAELQMCNQRPCLCGACPPERDPRPGEEAPF